MDIRKLSKLFGATPAETYRWCRHVFHQQRAHKHPATMSPARRRKLRKD